MELQSEDPKARARKKPKTEKSDIIEMNMCNKLSIKLMLRNMRKSQIGKRNIVCSPMSINLLLNMLAIGFTDGSTGQIELMNALGFKSVDEINRVSSKIMMLMKSKCNGEPSFEVGSAEYIELKNALDGKGPLFELTQKYNKNYGRPGLVIANGVWADLALPFKAQFVEMATQFYQSHTGTLDFVDEEGVVKEVNSWAENQTKGLIKDLISQDSLSNNRKNGKKTMLILANSLYFKGTWVDDFEESMTQVEKFHLLDGTTIEVPFMKDTSYRCYRSCNGFKLLRLPYRCAGNDYTKRFSMYLFLPELKNGLKGLLRKFKSDPSLVHTKCDRSENCITWIPKFNFMFEFKPSDIMKKMGLDLSKMGEPTDMVDIPKGLTGGCVPEVIQKSCIEVNEKGTKAASATFGYFAWQCSAGERPKPPPVRFVADCPFFFTIKDDVSGVVLFSGIVCNPLLS